MCTIYDGHVTCDVTWPPKVLWGSTVGYPNDSLASCFDYTQFCGYIFKTYCRIWIYTQFPLILVDGAVMQAMLVHTAETTRIRYFLDLLLQRKRPVMLVGSAGTGKTVLINDRVNSLSEDDYMVSNIPFNFYTTSEMLQHVMERPLEKKAGRNYGPPGTKNLIYFVDDMNMPEVRTFSLSCPSAAWLWSVCVVVGDILTNLTVQTSLSI